VTGSTAPATTVDLVVVGSGDAAQLVAHRMKGAGWSVVVVDSRPFGGTCAHRGCDPKKVLVGVAELIDWGRRMQGSGVSAPAATLVWSDMIAFKRAFVEHIPTDVENGFREAGITALHGRANFVGATTLAVGDETITGGHVVIAGGARHAPLGIPGEEHLTTSTAFFELDQLPPRVAFVGGGYIAFEFAQIAARAGAEVTILHRAERPLEAFDADLVGQLVEITRQLGVTVRLGTEVTAIDKSGDGLVVHARSGEQDQQLGAEIVVHAAGRIPEVDDLGLDAAGIERADDGGIAVNDYLQSISNPAVYAAGDAVTDGGFRLTPVAVMQAAVVATNLRHGNTRTPNYQGVPTVVFTTPPLARVGLTEAAASAQGLKFTTHHEDTTGWFSSRRLKLAHTGFKTLTEEGTGRVLGAHLLGPHAGEIINIFGLAIRHQLRVSDLSHTVYAYPTGASDISYML
jgi:glutathione reductase (NADPH)